MRKHFGVRQRQRWEGKLDSFSVLSWRPHRAVVHLREPENRDAIVVQRLVIEFGAHVDDVGDARAHDLINVGPGRDSSANGNTFGHEIVRYTQDTPKPIIQSEVAYHLPPPLPGYISPHRGL